MLLVMRVCAAILVVLIALGPAQAAPQAVIVFAAASLKNALDDAVQGFERDSHIPVTVSYAASSTLARQTESGAPADIFISADLDWMDYLQKRNLIRPVSRKNLLGNRLVLVAPAASTIKLAIVPGFGLAAALAGGRLAMANPQSVPAGRYGKAALEKLGVWKSAAPHIAAAENVRAALLFVDRGECPLGIVYATDAAADPGVRIVGIFPASTHPPIIYPIALTADSTNPAAPRLLEFLESPAAKPAFEKQGFTVVGAAE